MPPLPLVKKMTLPQLVDVPSYYGDLSPLMLTSDILILRGEYPPEQMWLPFVHAVMPPVIIPPHPKEDRISLYHRARSRHAHIDESDRLPYIPEENQYVLPFEEFRVLSAESKLAKCLHPKFHGFDRDHTGALLSLPFDRETGVPEPWIEMTKKRIVIEKWMRNVIFEDLEDFTVCRLMT